MSHASFIISTSLIYFKGTWIPYVRFLFVYCIHLSPVTVTNANVVCHLSLDVIAAIAAITLVRHHGHLSLSRHPSSPSIIVTVRCCYHPSPSSAYRYHHPRLCKFPYRHPPSLFASPVLVVTVA